MISYMAFIRFCLDLKQNSKGWTTHRVLLWDWNPKNPIRLEWAWSLRGDFVLGGSSQLASVVRTTPHLQAIYGHVRKGSHNPILWGINPPSCSPFHVDQLTRSFWLGSHKALTSRPGKIGSQESENRLTLLVGGAIWRSQGWWTFHVGSH